MKKSRFTENQIIAILKEGEAGVQVKEICRKHGISDATYYNWKSKYGGMGASDLKRTKEMEQQLSQLKRMYADMALENRALKDLIEKNCCFCNNEKYILKVYTTKRAPNGNR